MRKYRKLPLSTRLIENRSIRPRCCRPPRHTAFSFEVPKQNPSRVTKSSGIIVNESVIFHVVAVESSQLAYVVVSVINCEANEAL